MASGLNANRFVSNKNGLTNGAFKERTIPMNLSVTNLEINKAISGLNGNLGYP